MAALAVALSTVIGLAIGEAFVRLALPPVPGDEGSNAEYLMATQRNPGAPRLFPAGYSAVFDVRGLYAGGDKVDFHVGPGRFIAPEPTGKARYKVLFLGGSVTEGIFIPDDARWPGRLADGAEIATYNAGMSAAGMLGQYITAKYLADRGDRFDLVVLATNHNDATWSRRFLEINSRYRFDNYVDGARAIYEKEFQAERKPEGFSLRTVAWFRHLMRVKRMSSSTVAASAPEIGAQKPPSLVVAGLLKLQDGQQNLPKAKIAECSGEDAPLRLKDIVSQDWNEIFPRFKSEMKRLLGAELLVVSEPSTYGAPSSSFYYADMRVPLTCKTQAGVRMVETADTIAFMRARADAYLDAARAAGAMTFDLAGAIDPVANGPEGGLYFFDSMHPTPKGAATFAELIRPALKQALENAKKE